MEAAYLSGGDGLQMWKLTANILHKKSQTADKGWCSRFGVEDRNGIIVVKGATLSTSKIQLITSGYN
jgi:hypothetical protein